MCGVCWRHPNTFQPGPGAGPWTEEADGSKAGGEAGPWSPPATQGTYSGSPVNRWAPLMDSIRLRITLPVALTPVASS